MTDRSELGQLAGDFVVSSWDDTRATQAFDGFKRKKRNQQVARAVAACLAVLALGGLLFWGTGQGDTVDVPAPTIASNEGGDAAQPDEAPRVEQLVEGGRDVLAFYDGSRAESLADGTEMKVSVDTDEQLRIDLTRGHARFEVTPNRERRFEVDAGDVQVTVLGTIFEVDRQDGRAAVHVERGHVRVTAGDQSWDLLAGQGGVFPPEEDEAAPTETASKDPTPAARPRKARKLARRDDAWKGLVEQGKFKDAARILIAKPKLVRDDASDLMLAADAMRYAGEPGRAARYLERVSRDHRHDRRASTAAFTRGLLLLRDLKRYDAAAGSFAQVQDLGPTPALAEDALAREVEAWHRAGERSRATARAKLYLERYPRGHRADAVRHYGAIK